MPFPSKRFGSKEPKKAAPIKMEEDGEVKPKISANVHRPKRYNRQNHHCPGGSGRVDGFRGNCRITEYPMHHCETHQNYCLKHETTTMKSKGECISCRAEKERRYDFILTWQSGQLYRVDAD